MLLGIKSDCFVVNGKVCLTLSTSGSKYPPIISLDIRMLRWGGRAAMGICFLIVGQWEKAAAREIFDISCSFWWYGMLILTRLYWKNEGMVE